MKFVYLATLALAVAALANPGSYYPLQTYSGYSPNNHGDPSYMLPSKELVSFNNPTPVVLPTKPTSTPTATSTSSTSYDYSYEIDLSGFNSKITHFFVSYSDPWVSGGVGVGSVLPKPTPPPPPTLGVICDRSFPGLLAGIGLDLGLRLNLSLIGINACIGL
ncbi:hypothetical protein DL89DRAFT_149258 [Linderina pennispora]|uniref:Uncharacterized protein n=1 Tax=Linderina pennispora TaxID=61395 RepID=A0A1Y1W9Y9_9FUNG|nr:uncharacterized protein DL89DRAFT_149258 [Linderina pennispora]ORX69954.1 hypothetical protein DL89DRAFT_149258 [Linderina pennispora]